MLTRSPLPFGHIGSPFLPVFRPLPIFPQPLFFLGDIFDVINDDHGQRIGLDTLAPAKVTD